MPLYLAVPCFVVVFVGAWLLRGVVVRWCSLCGRQVGAMCTACTHSEQRERELLAHPAEGAGLPRQGALT